MQTGFSAENEVRVFPHGWNSQVVAFAPTAVAGTLAQLRMAANAVNNSPLLSLTRALIVLERPDAPRLKETERDWLWKTFGLPIFQQVIGARGHLLAAECEAHDGLHVDDRLPMANPPNGGLHVEAAVGVELGRLLTTFTDVEPGARAIMLREPCACGRLTPRIWVVGSKTRMLQKAAYAR